MTVLYQPAKANVVADSLSCITMGSVSHVEEAKKDLVKGVHRFASLGIRLEYTPNGGFLVHRNSESSFGVEVSS